MRFLIVNLDYVEFLDDLYAADPRLADLSFERQAARRAETLFSLADFYSSNLRALGHDALEVHANNQFLQTAWARSFAPALAKRPDVMRNLLQRLRNAAARTPIRRLSPFLRPFLTSLDRPDAWLYDVLSAQVEWYRPDVVLIQAVDVLDPAAVRRIVPRAALLVGETAAFPPLGIERGQYDLVLSSLPSVVERFRALGFRAHEHQLGFEARVAELVPPRERDVPVSFVGSLHPIHVERLGFLERLAEEMPDLAIWANNVDWLPRDSILRGRNRGRVWGRAMYEVLARSVITVNRHDGAPAARYANNLRLYEATGMGALLLTDWKENLSDIFDLDTEVVAYHTVEEAIERLRDLRERPDAAAAVAAAGQRRTLNDHTYRRRMEQLVEVVSRYL